MYTAFLKREKDLFDLGQIWYSRPTVRHNLSISVQDIVNDMNMVDGVGFELRTSISGYYGDRRRLLIPTARITTSRVTREVGITCRPTDDRHYSLGEERAR